MWIKSTREAHAGNEFKDSRVNELNDGNAVSFNESGTAQVPAEVGEYLTAEYDVFVDTDDEQSGDAEADTTADVDAAEDDTTNGVDT